VSAIRPRGIVVIGGSAGAPGPVQAILRDLPADTNAAIFVVLHRHRNLKFPDQ